MKLVLSALVLMSGVAAAQPAPNPTEPADPPLRYLLGVGAVERPEYDGAARYALKFKPLWALQWGRWRLSTSGSSSLLGFGRGGAGPGASTELLNKGPWRVNLALRFDSGRDSGEARTTQGLPDVRRTLRARLAVTYALTPDWALTTGASQDLLGRHGGLTGGVDLSWRFYRSQDTEWMAGGGLSGANAQNMRSYFGIDAAGSVASGKPVYEPGAGLRSTYAGVGFTHRLAPHWLAFGSTGVSRLLGPAAASPLTEQRNGASLTMGIAWRN